MNLLFFILVPMLISSPMADAQAPPPSTNNTNPYGFSPNFNPSMAIVIVVLISAFFFLGFFSIYIRQCGGDTSGSVPAPRGGAGRSRRNRGLDPDLLATFPTLVYSEVKEHKIGKGSLECAVCITEFEDDETLRLLPHCSHVFHPDCIDAWLASHVTCPVCRSNLAEPAPAIEDSARDEEAPSPPEHVTIEVDRKADLAELSRIASRRKGVRLPRSHSTGHSLVLEHKGDQDRFTLRLPEHVRREIVTRAGSMRGLPMGGEESSKRGYRGEGSSRIGRSIRLGRSGRWPSFFIRSMSMKMPGWAMGRRGEGEGSMKKGDAGEGSARGKMATVRAQFECLSGGKSGAGAGEEDESTSGALGRV